MPLAARLARLDALLPVYHELWHAQPFCQARPAWCARWPELTAALLALPDEAVETLVSDEQAALAFLSSWLPEVRVVTELTRLPTVDRQILPDLASRWAREIPGRKQAQILAFAASIQAEGQSVLDWCGGKGHLGRLLGLLRQQPVTTLELDPVLCDAGRQLAARLPVQHEFEQADALTAAACFRPHQHAVALHACGHLHRRLIQQGVAAGLVRLDLAPCCYHRGLSGDYPAFSTNLQTRLSLDDTRLAVTETVTASPRLRRKRDKEMAWKLGFDLIRREMSGVAAYQHFKPVPAPWFAGDFAGFLQKMLARQGFSLPAGIPVETYEAAGWQRQREVMRLSIPRFAFRRALEVWMALDLSLHLQSSGYAVRLGSFCERHLTPRNLLISAWRESGN
jgi:hypothetical protein